jgi:hypothetical protein
LKTRSNLPRRALATALALCAHLMALLLLGWRIPRLAAPEPADDHGPAVEVTLLRPPSPPRDIPAKAAARALKSSPRPVASPRVLVAPTPEAPPLAAPDQKPPAPPPADNSLDNPRLRDALRGGVGCADPAAYHLSREERAACDQRLAAARPAPVGPQFRAEELAQFDAENRYDPIVVRKPHNGCLPRVGAIPPPGNPGTPPRAARSGASTTLGLNCAWSF